AAAASTAPASKPSCTVRGVPVSSARVTTERPPTWASGRQASQRSAPGSTPRRALVARAEAATASWVSTTALGSPVVPLVATTSASPSATGSSGRAAASTRSRAGPGRRGSRGRTASPSSQARRSRSTNAGVPRASTTTSRRTASAHHGDRVARADGAGAHDVRVDAHVLVEVAHDVAQYGPVLGHLGVDLPGHHDAAGARRADLDLHGADPQPAAHPAHLGVAGGVAGVDEHAGPEAAHVDD